MYTFFIIMYLVLVLTLFLNHVNKQSDRDIQRFFSSIFPATVKKKFILKFKWVPLISGFIVLLSCVIWVLIPGFKAEGSALDIHIELSQRAKYILNIGFVYVVYSIALGLLISVMLTLIIDLRNSPKKKK